MITAKNSLKNATIEATVRRADGTVERLGVIARLDEGQSFRSKLVSFFKK